MSEGHERYFVNLAGVAICVECSDRCGFSVEWEVAEGALHSRLNILADPTPPVRDDTSAATWLS